MLPGSGDWPTMVPAGWLLSTSVVEPMVRPYFFTSLRVTSLMFHWRKLGVFFWGISGPMLTYRVTTSPSLSSSPFSGTVRMTVSSASSSEYSSWVCTVMVMPALVAAFLMSSSAWREVCPTTSTISMAGAPLHTST